MVAEVKGDAVGSHNMRDQIVHLAAVMVNKQSFLFDLLTLIM
jgi:hypothetical protein